MKKYILILGLLVAFFSSTHLVFATSGACSFNGGVNCAAGAAADGNAICNDGTESSISYSSMDECSSTVFCTASGTSQILQVYTAATTQTEKERIKESVDSVISTTQQNINSLNAVTQAGIAQINAQCSSSQSQISSNQQDAVDGFQAEACSLNEFCNTSSTLSEGVQGINSRYSALSSQLQNECSAQVAAAQAQGNLQTANLQTCLTGLNSLKTAMVSADNNCPYKYAFNSSNCVCNTGYEVNASKTSCVIIPSCPTGSSDVSGTCVSNQAVVPVSQVTPVVTQAPVALPAITTTKTPVQTINTRPIATTIKPKTKADDSLNFLLTPNNSTTSTDTPNQSDENSQGFWQSVGNLFSRLNPFSWFR